MKEGKLQLNMQDEIIRETMVTQGGEIVNARVREFFKTAGSAVSSAVMEGAIMPADFISNLYVFILAGFVGFEVIKRVSPLLHTPLMSLTNALDAIVVVAAIIIAGRHETRLTDDPGRDRGRGIVQQHGGRISDYRPHAAHVQIRQVEKIMTTHALQQYLDFAYIVAVVLFILSLKFLSSPAQRALGRSGGRDRRGAGGRRHAFQS